MILLGLFAAILTTQAASPDHRIVGGVEVQPPGAYPHQGYLNRQVNGFSCGCVLVDDNITITAAHCVDGVDPSRVTVGFGAHDRVTKLEGEPLEYGIVQIAVHPNWTNSGAVGFPYDLAVMMMNMSAKVESPYIQPIPLPEPGRTPDDFEGKACVITGWGRPSAVGQPTNLLMEAQTQVINETLCQEQWSPQQVGDYHVCVWEPVDQDTGACNGDSGGPLVCTDDAGVTELVGLTSWGVSGCSPTFPSVYARVSFFREWIDGVLAEWTR